MEEYQQLLRELLKPSDWEGPAKDRFVKKSGWRKIATAFDLDVIRVESGVERDDQGVPLRAWATYRAIAPSGRQMDGDGYCTIDEFTGKRRNNPKLENDMRGTATTRAKNRAIADLVGMGDVSAEETIPGSATSAPSSPTTSTRSAGQRPSRTTRAPRPTYRRGPMPDKDRYDQRKAA
jgi:hypothetical protein